MFPEESLYRIDHFLGKETVQNLMVTRFGNIIFEPIWNRTYIDHVQITAAESMGIESRGAYYDKSGALRDMVQNHLLQLLGIIAMEPPVSIDATNVRNETMKVFKALRPHTEESLRTDIIRGQYAGETKDGENIPGYLDEEGIPSDSSTESFVALKLFIDNWRWKDVPFYIRTGKRMEARVTEVVIHFKKTPHHIFADGKHTNANTNQLIIRIQPDEGMLIKFGIKVPGAGFSVTEKNLHFHYADDHNIRLPEAYERLLLDSLNDDATLYARADAVKETWQYIDPILQFWKKNPQHNLYPYKPGTWGPEEAHQLLARKGSAWRNPCSGLEDDFCSL
jgi:glucose-6-phosphate 1-dehydrogenase